MTPLERYIKWKHENPERFRQAQVSACMRYSISQPELTSKLLRLETWLETHANNKKANKKDWFRFVLNWLSPKDWQKPPEPRWYQLPEDKPRRQGANNYDAQSVGRFLGRVFNADTIVVPTQTDKPQTFAHLGAKGQTLPPVMKVLNTCENCGASPVPLLYNLESKRVCALCYVKATE